MRECRVLCGATDSWSQGCRVQEGAKDVVVVVPLIVRLDWLVIFRAPILLNVGILCYNAVVRPRPPALRPIHLAARAQSMQIAAHKTWQSTHKSWNKEEV